MRRHLLASGVKITFEVTSRAAAEDQVQALENNVVAAVTGGALVANVQAEANKKGVLTESLKSMPRKQPAPTVGTTTVTVVVADQVRPTTTTTTVTVAEDDKGATTVTVAETVAAAVKAEIHGLIVLNGLTKRSFTLTKQLGFRKAVA